MASSSFEGLRVYRLVENLSDQIWHIVCQWDYLAKDTVGKQLIRAADSVGANIAEGSGRGTYRENRHLVRIARGSLYEVRHWLRRAAARGLLDATQTQSTKPLLAELAPTLNAYLRSIGPASPTNDK